MVTPTLGDPCPAGAECSYSDDCGSVTYGCVDGVWAQTDASGCGAGAVPCADGPEADDPCDGLGEVCDPDGDCREVLECGAFYWEAFDVCTDVVCSEADPIMPGAACDSMPTQFCSGGPPCEAFTYRCLDGVWSVFGGGAVPPECQ